MENGQINKRESSKILQSAFQRQNTPLNFPNFKTKRWQKKVTRDWARAYKDIKNMKVKLKLIEKGTEKYKKRLQIINIQTDAKTNDSSRSKTARLLKNQIVNGIVRKKLVFQYD